MLYACHLGFLNIVVWSENFSGSTIDSNEFFKTTGKVCCDLKKSFSHFVPDETNVIFFQLELYYQLGSTLDPVCYIEWFLK